jgi:hypothetical protein
MERDEIVIRKGNRISMMKREEISTMKRLLLLLLALLVVCFGLLPCSPARALEGGSSHYPGTMEDFFAGALPPPGVYMIDYMPIFSSNKLVGNNGSRNPNVTGFQMDGVFNAPRILWVSPWKVLGGNFAFHVFPNVGYMHVRMDTPGGSRSQSKTGMGDLDIGPAIKWNFKTFHMLAACDIYMPTGAYDKNDLVNIGLNYWSINPIYAFTYIGDKDSPIPGFEVSAKLDYLFNTTNNATGYTSGQQFGVNYLVAQHFGKWGFGVNGQWMYQTTDDSYRNQTADFNGNRTNWFSIGPAVQYQVGKAFLTAKYIADVSNKNGAQVNKVLLKITFPF